MIMNEINTFNLFGVYLDYFILFFLFLFDFFLFCINWNLWIEEVIGLNRLVRLIGLIWFLG